MHKRPGFTIVELLVVIAIIGILAALLLPAVQAARESSRRLQCVNNLKQIGLAFHGYHNINNALPAGNVIKTAGTCPGNNKSGVQSDDGANWLILILPFIEQKSLFDSYDLTAYNEGMPNKRVRETHISIYACPSESSAE